MERELSWESPSLNAADEKDLVHARRIEEGWGSERGKMSRKYLSEKMPTLLIPCE